MERFGVNGDQIDEEMRDWWYKAQAWWVVPCFWRVPGGGPLMDGGR